MEGKVLGFDATTGTGAIKGADGARYTFAAADWRGAAPAKAGDDVDFTIEGAMAKEIYVTRTGLNLDLGGLGGVAGSIKAEGGVAGVFLSSWSAILAAATLVACFLPFISAGGQSENLFGVVEMAGTLKTGLSGYGMAAAMFGGEVETPGFVGVMKTLLGLYPLFYLIPIAAIWVLVYAFINKPMRLPTLVSGALTLGLPIVLILLGGMMVVASMPSEMREMMSQGGGGGLEMGLGLGGWLIVILGAAQLANALGHIKATPAALLKKG